MTERLTKEQIKEIKKLDILSYFKNYQPDELIRMGRNDSYCLKSHRSLKISNGKWCWWANGKVGGISALDYLIKVEGYDFKDACFYLRDLMNDLPPVMEIPRQKRNTGLLLPKPNDSDSEVFFYLTTERGLDPNLVENLMARRLIYEEAGSHNAVFLGFNERNVPAYAFKRSIYTGNKMEAAGSSKAYSFRLENPDSKDLHLFEGAIDLLSYVTIRIMKDVPWEDQGYLSLGGITGEETVPVALVNYLERCPNVKNLYIHFDRDSAGMRAGASLKNTLSDSFNIEDRILAYYKDENEQLTEYKKGNLLCTNIW